MLSLKGFLDAPAAAELREAFENLAYVKDLVLDLNSLVGLSLEGVCEIMRIEKRMRKKGSFSLVNAKTALPVLQRTGLKERLKILS